MNRTDEIVQKGKFDEYYITNLVYTVKSFDYFIGIAKNKTFVIYGIDDNGNIDMKNKIQQGTLPTFHDDIQVVYDPKQSKQYLCCINTKEEKLEIYNIYADGSIKLLDSYVYTRESKEGSAVYALNGKFYFYEQSRRTLEWIVRRYVKE